LVSLGCSKMKYITEIDIRGVMTVSINRPDIHNAFNDELILDLIVLFKDLQKNDKVRLIILTGIGKSFCAGADLVWMSQMKDYSYEENLADSEKLAELFTVINNSNKPTIAKINGAALGGGAGLVACCDYAISLDSATFGFTEVRLGLVPAVISPFVIAKIGEGHARATFLSGARFNAARALQIGLVHQVSTVEKLEADIEVVITEFLQAAPKASILAKKLIKEVVKFSSIEEARNYTCQTISKIRVATEGQEGMSALLEKRKASWL
jgi:methylglutaconyl-CoA hydratase